MIMFQTLNDPGRITAHMLSSIPRPLIKRYVGISPPPKNIVIMKIVLKIFLPLKSSLDMGYAHKSVMKTDMKANNTEYKTALKKPVHIWEFVMTLS